MTDDDLKIGPAGRSPSRRDSLGRTAAARSGLGVSLAAAPVLGEAPAVDALPVRASQVTVGAADGLSGMFHPTPPTLAEHRRILPGLVDVVRLENTGHWMQHEAADRVNAALLDFLGGIGQEAGEVARDG